MNESLVHGVRQAERRDIRRLAELWAHAFPGERTVEARVRQLEEGGVFGGIEDAWYVERDGRLAGAFRGYPLTQYLHGTALPMLGLAAVAVAADARRAGIGRQLCAAAARVGCERGDVVSVLFPFRPEFYRRLGWGLAGSLHSHRFAPESLRLPAAPARVQLAREELLPGVQDCYERAAQASHGLIRRNAAIWRNQLGAGARHPYALVRDGQVHGYALVSYGLADSAERRVLHVHEVIAPDRASYLEILGWISLQRDAWRVVQYDALPEERFELLLADPRPPGFRPHRVLWAPTAQVIRGPMLRLLDVARALEQRRAWGSAEPLRFTLALRDELLPENAGPWQVDFDGTAVRCRPGNGGDAVLAADAAAFAQIWAGELRVADAVRLGLVEADGGVAALDALFRTAHTLRLLDEF